MWRSTNIWYVFKCSCECIIYWCRVQIKAGQIFKVYLFIKRNKIQTGWKLFCFLFIYIKNNFALKFLNFGFEVNLKKYLRNVEIEDWMESIPRINKTPSLTLLKPEEEGKILQNVGFWKDENNFPINLFYSELYFLLSLGCLYYTSILHYFR